MSTTRPRSPRTANRRPGAPATRKRAARAANPQRPNSDPPIATGWFRRWLERLSRPVLVRLARAPSWLVGLIPAVLLLGGLLAPLPWGPVLLGVVTLFLAWLLVLAWPSLDVPARAVRTGTVALVIAVTIARSGGVF